MGTVSVLTAETEEVVFSEVTASIVLKGISKSNFGAVRQLNFRKAVAAAVMVGWSQVTINAIATASRRRLLGSSIEVSFTITADSAEEGFGVQQTMASAQFG